MVAADQVLPSGQQVKNAGRMRQIMNAVLAVDPGEVADDPQVVVGLDPRLRRLKHEAVHGLG